MKICLKTKHFAQAKLQKSVSYIKKIKKFWKKSLKALRSKHILHISFSTISIIGLIVSPLSILLYNVPSAAAATLFEDNFDQSGSALTSNGWDNISGESGGDRQATSGDDFTVGVSSKGILLEGQSASNPDETAQRIFSTHGYRTLHISYSRAISSFESGDSFVAQYSLDDGAFVNLETLTTNQAHAAATFDVDNTNRNTKLVVRFMVNGNEGNDEAGIDNFTLTGEGDPLFYDGFESNDFGAGSYASWTTEQTPTITTTAANVWTNDNTTSNGHAA